MSVWESNLASHIAAALIRMGVPKVVNVVITELPLWRVRVDVTVNLGVEKLLCPDQTVTIDSWPLGCPLRDSRGHGIVTRILTKLGVY